MKKKKKSKSTSLRIEEQRLYNYWQAMVLSFFSNSLYWDVYKRWRGIGILYLLLMVSLLSIPYGIKTTIEMNQYFNQKLIEPFERVPDIPYVSGKIKFDKKMPYLIKNDKGKVETIIDNTGTYKKFDRTKFPSLRFLFLNDKLLYTMPEAVDYLTDSGKAKPAKIREFNVPKDVSFVFNGEQFLKDYQIKNLKKITLTSIYPIVASTFCFVTIIFLLPIAMMGQIVSHTIFKVRISFKESCRLLIMASTPPFCILQVMAVGKLYQQYIGFVWLGLLAMYFSFAIINLKRNLQSIARL